MADNGSGSVASVAIVILVILALFIGYYFFVKQGRLEVPSASPSKVEVNVPAPAASSEKPAS